MAEPTTKDVAKALGLSSRTIRAYAAPGKIPFTCTPGGHRRFEIEAVRCALYPRQAKQSPSMALLQNKRSEILAAASRFGASNVRVFGSVATGTADQESDIDLLVTLERGRSYADIEDLNHTLEDLLGCPVDILSQGACHGRFAKIPQVAIPL